MAGGAESASERTIVYCLVPYDLAGKLHEPLRRHFADDPSIEVVVEQRGRERRRADRRAASRDEAPATERRAIRNPEGRRAGERRGFQAAIEAPELPRRARAHAERLAFVERVAPSTQHSEDLDTARLIIRFQAGDSEAFADIYVRYFDRVYSYLRVIFRHSEQAEDAAQECMLRVFEALPRYERRRQPFRAWLFTVVRNHAYNTLARESRLDILEPEEIARRREQNGDESDELSGFDWITDQDLMLFIDRLPLAQRQALVLRYLMDLPDSEIAAILDRSPSDVRMLQSRAVRFLRERLTAVGRAPKPTYRSRMRRSPRHAAVLRARRWALLRY